MNTRISWLVAAAGIVLAGACDDSDDSVQPNTHFTAGNTSISGASTGGKAPGSGGASDVPVGGGPDGGGGPSAAGAGEGPQAGAGGASPQEPPYDCVLNPTTYLEIINACTAAVRIEKHPELPPIE